MPEALKIDRLDLRILAQLQKNGRMTNVDLADAVGLSPSPCLIDPGGRRDSRMPPGQRRLRLSAALPDTWRQPLPGNHRGTARTQHRHRQVLQLLVIKSPFIKTHCPIERLFPHQR